MIKDKEIIISKGEKMMGNTFGRIFRVTTCGESYGIGKGSGLAVIVDGVPSGIKLNDQMIQEEMDKRKPGQGKLDSPRMETDLVHIFAGIGQDEVTTGAPVGMIIYNVDTQKIHVDQYREYKDLFRPGHAAYPFFLNMANSRIGAEREDRLQRDCRKGCRRRAGKTDPGKRRN
jgi:chorismate synthase